jgi:D-alanyl-lipoteichoic acid acyltransferase DltB (MBOAT superfamily)
MDYIIGNQLYKAKSINTKKILILACLTINLSLLGFFKYAHFITEHINTLFGLHLYPINFLTAFYNGISGNHIDIAIIFLPVGISFYTFQSLSYAIDIYRGTIKPIDNFLDYAFFVSFFPQLVAGPIVRASEFLPQVSQPYLINNEDFTRAIYLIIAGLAKKIIISDFISINFVDRVFTTPNAFTGFENLMAIYGYALQIYCDFSGYTDIAIGVALLLGFRLSLNFDRPYTSLNITDFWRRWHISLSRWLKDYLYISLGGNRNGTIATYFNLFITMVLGGLWHGAHMKFIIWGALHGLALCIHKIWIKTFQLPDHKFYKYAAGIITFHFVAFCWIFFRAENLNIVGLMLSQISNNFQFTLIPAIISGYAKVFTIILIGFVIHFTSTSYIQMMCKKFSEYGLIKKAVIITAFILCIYQFKTSELQPFIYFQF